MCLGRLNNMVRILHLYYDLLNLYGEYANITVLYDNLIKNGIDVQIDRHSIGDKFDFCDYDFIYCGSGTESKTDLALKDFVGRKESFINSINKNKYILFTGSSILLLGKNGINVFDYQIEDSKKRICGDIICSCQNYDYIVGYVNSSYNILYNEKPYYTLLKCDNDLKKYEGIAFKKNNLLTVNFTGPLLIKNPQLLKDLIIVLAKIENENFVFKDTINKYQHICHEITLEQLIDRFN